MLVGSLGLAFGCEYLSRTAVIAQESLALGNGRELETLHERARARDRPSS